MNIPIGVIRQTPVDGRYGFPFHEACWSLLEQAYSTKGIPLGRLFEVCRSLPFSNRIGHVTWDHDFGGLVVADEDSYPWEDLFVEQEVTFASSNPYVVPEIQQLHYETPTSPDVSKTTSNSADIFADVPLEIINSISLYLPTNDYLNARLALRSFYSVFYMQQFWASKFLPYADRSWVFESQNWGMTCNWLWLYHRTANGSPGMKNRERVWRLVENVEEILRSNWIEPLSYSITDVCDMKWLKAAGDVRPNTRQPRQAFFGGGCLQFHAKYVHMPPDQLSQLAFSLIRLENATYITGIRFIFSRGEDVSLGYMAQEQHIVGVTCLIGFHLAVGSRGIQGIQCILGNGRESPWIGCPDNAPKTKRLLFTEPMTGIEVGFDVSFIFSCEFRC